MKKSKHGQSPKGAQILRAREEKRRRSMIVRPTTVEPVVLKSPGIITGLIKEFPVLALVGANTVLDPEMVEAIDKLLLGERDV